MGRILLVDDEPHTLEIVALTAQHAGHTVTKAIDGLQALGLYRERPKRFDLVYTDWWMPPGQDGGLLLVNGIYDVDPQQPVVVTSAIDKLEFAGLPPNVREIVYKPATPSRVRAVLAKYSGH